MKSKDNDERPGEAGEGAQGAISRRGFIVKSGLIAGAGGAILGALGGCSSGDASSSSPPGPQDSGTTWTYTVPGPFTPDVPVGIQQQAGSFAQVMDVELKQKPKSGRLILRFAVSGTPSSATQIQVDADLIDANGDSLTSVSRTTSDARSVTPDPEFELSGRQLSIPEHNTEIFQLDDGIVEQVSSITLTLTLL